MVDFKNAVRSEDAESRMSKKFLLLFTIGFFIILAGIIIIIVAAVLYGGDSAIFGGIIFIGLVPIVFGAGLEASLMILFSLILAVLSVIIYVIFRKEIKASN
jgi:uncharacterized membrane protein